MDTLRFAVRKYDPFETALQKAWEAFCVETGCTLKFEAVPMDLHPLYDALIGKEDGLAKGDWDIAHMNTDWIAEAYEKDKIIDLKKYIQQKTPQNFPEGWSSSMREMQMFDDKIVGLPFHNGPECLIYRKDLFEDPNEQEAFKQQFGRELIPPKTWDELVDIAHFFQRPEQNLFGTAIAAFPDGHNTVFDFCLQIWTRGGELLDENGNVFIDTPEAQEGLSFYKSLLTDNKAVHPDCIDMDSVKMGMAFANGEIAMAVNWFGFASMCEVYEESKVKGKVDISNIPAGPKGEAVSLNAYWMYTIGKGSKRKDLAYDFIEFLTRAEQDKALTFEGGIGCRLSTWQDEEVNKTVPYYHKLTQLHQHARNLPRKAHWAKLSEVIDTIVIQVLEGKMSVEEILKEGQAAITKIEKEANAN